MRKNFHDKKLYERLNGVVQWTPFKRTKEIWKVRVTDEHSSETKKHEIEFKALNLLKVITQAATSVHFQLKINANLV